MVSVAAGCGGGGKKPVTKAEYEAQMEPIAGMSSSMKTLSFPNRARSSFRRIRPIPGVVSRRR